MINDLLLRLMLAGSVAAALVLVLRRPMRAWGGAGGAYLLWAIVPASLLATLVPRAAAGNGLSITLPGGAVAAGQAIASALPADGGATAALPLAWLVGALATAGWLAWRQRSFERHVGLAPDGRRRSVVRLGDPRSGPVLVGVLRPTLVLPADFRHAYDCTERRLVLAHERVHAERGDLLANALCALLQCLCWCNPLIHFAARRFRIDQELACDELVLRRHGRAAIYARTMLKVQLSTQNVPLACQWQAPHPLKERIMNLKSQVSPARRSAGQFVAAALLAATSLAACTTSRWNCPAPTRACRCAPASPPR